MYVCTVQIVNGHLFLRILPSNSVLSSPHTLFPGKVITSYLKSIQFSFFFYYLSLLPYFTLFTLFHILFEILFHKSSFFATISTMVLGEAYPPWLVSLRPCLQRNTCISWNGIDIHYLSLTSSSKPMWSASSCYSRVGSYSLLKIPLPAS